LSTFRQPQLVQPVTRVVDPMQEFESFQAAEDKVAVATDTPQRIS
jgi:hypothetical protein